jgi:hypothetical protein
LEEVIPEPVVENVEISNEVIPEEQNIINIRPHTLLKKKKYPIKMNQILI